MGRHIGIAMYLHTSTPPYERMEIGPFPQECNEGIVGRLVQQLKFLEN